eukprot:m.24760 g.24760  ORF g.24760 m.24760 type:complete len:252 (+) comp8635_c0_seq2:204-959(+)
MAAREGVIKEYHRSAGTVTFEPLIRCEPGLVVRLLVQFTQLVGSPNCLFYLGLVCYFDEEGTDVIPSHHRYRYGSGKIARVDLQSNTIVLTEPARGFNGGPYAAVMIYLDGNADPARKADFLLHRPDNGNVFEGGSRENVVDVNGQTEIKLGVPIPAEVAQRLTPDSVVVSCSEGGTFHYCVASGLKADEPVEREFDASVYLDKFGYGNDCVYPGTKSVRIMALPNCNGAAETKCRLTFWDVSVTKKLQLN